MIQEATFEFLRKLEVNNNREWFLENKNEYEIAKANFVDFCEEVLEMLKVIEPSFANTQIKDCIFRINRDIRFAKDKRPYKNNLSAGFGAGGRNSGKIDYYFQLQNGETMIGAGMWQPSSENLAKFRQELDYNPEVLKGIIDTPKFKDAYPIVHGEKLKRAPKNYSEDHPEIELLKHKELFFVKKFSNEKVKQKDFLKQLFYHLEVIKPYIDYLNELFYN
ncbi:DUF2461 domain-containing protein [Lacihabitans sp. LS3-19]|uniref:DUF2461 domain-containing protein n=1 Tax=Lacihabitans sp. LS3-19 TaxID=2487335 RepID=UPI0020CF9A79|nr:DUF2461 domain-containing protein [Lacihabitans sp. LS3-19]MCP9769858.1 DUF2461 domain-containing protein [Lacihabitans sp. LS3-19]